MNRFLKLGVNKHGKDFIIGDIHGKYTPLMEAMEHANFNKETDRLFSVGDLDIIFCAYPDRLGLQRVLHTVYAPKIVEWEIDAPEKSKFIHSNLTSTGFDNLAGNASERGSFEFSR